MCTKKRLTRLLTFDAGDIFLKGIDLLEKIVYNEFNLIACEGTSE